MVNVLCVQIKNSIKRGTSLSNPLTIPAPKVGAKSALNIEQSY